MSQDSSIRKRKIVGVVGGVASGKSAVARFLAELGGVVLNADQITHEVLQLPDVIDALVKHFGPEILKNRPSGDSGPGLGKSPVFSHPAELQNLQLDRAAIAKLVFGDTEHHQSNRSFLESVVQTRVRDRLLEELKTWQESSPGDAQEVNLNSSSESFLVLDVPLLFERDWDRYCDFVLMVDTPEAKRKENAAQRGWSDSEWRSRELNQWPVSRKRERATHILVNDSDLERLQEQVLLWHASNFRDSGTK